MTYGMRTQNLSDIVNIDENSRSYVYLGKLGPFYDPHLPYSGPGSTDARPYVDVTCVGFPIVFCSVPYATADDVEWYRSGLAIYSVESLGSNVWRVLFNGGTGDNSGATSMNFYLRIFGRLDLNFPSGSAETYGARIWNGASELIFDSGLPMLRLAGNTYDTEILLKKEFPDDPYTAPGSTDTAVSMPFSMAGKSICANVRGYITTYLAYGSYTDDGLTYTQYNFWKWGTSYWANGSTLYARKIPDEFHQEDVSPGLSGYDLSHLADVYTKVAVINDSDFP